MTKQYQKSEKLPKPGRVIGGLHGILLLVWIYVLSTTQALPANLPPNTLALVSINPSPVCKNTNLLILGNGFIEPGHSTKVEIIRGAWVVPLNINVLSNDSIVTQIPVSAPSGPGILLKVSRCSGQNVTIYAVSDTMTIRPWSTFSYTDTLYCEAGDTALPSLTGAPISFLGYSHPRFLPNSGGIALNPLGTADTLSIPWQQTSCPSNTGLERIIILPRDSSWIFYTSPQSYQIICRTDGPVVPANVSLPSGTFSVQPPTGLALQSNGDIHPASSTSDTFRVYHLPAPGRCADSSFTDVVIVGLDTVLLDYPYTDFCTNAPAFGPSVLSDPGGIFSAITLTPGSNPNLAIDPPTGNISPMFTSPGAYQVYYTTSHPTCSQRFAAASPFLAIASMQPSLRYPNNNLICENDADSIVPVQIVPPGGVFASLDNSLAIHPTTGKITVLNWFGPPPSIRYTPPPDSCYAPITVPVQLVPNDTSSHVSYLNEHGQPVFCKGGGTLSPTITGNPNGLFASSPPGLQWEDQTAGKIDLDASMPGNYDIHYQVGEYCNDAITFALSILGYDNAGFSFAEPEYCLHAGKPKPSSIVTPGGTFFAKDSGLQLDPLTGELDLQHSLSGEYHIYYSTQLSCPSTDSFAVRIHPAPSPLQYAIEPGLSLCAGMPVEFTCQTANPISFMINGALSHNEDATYLYLTPKHNDQVRIIYQNDFECKDSISLVLQVHQFPEIDVRNESEVVLSDDSAKISISPTLDATSVHFQMESVGLKKTAIPSGQTEPLNIFFPTTIATRVELISETQIGTLTWFLQPERHGCWGETDTVLTYVSTLSKEVFIPELISPNGDGLNDTWLVRWTDKIDPNAYRILLFNNLGGQVYKMSPLTPLWDAANLPEGIYWWLLEDERGRVYRKGGLAIRRK